MTLPRKGSKRIVVEGNTYRYVGYLSGYLSEKRTGELDELTIGADIERGELLRAYFSYEPIRQAYLSVGRTLGKFGAFPPYVVAQTIRIGLRSGWTPTTGGGMRTLGRLDDVINYSDLKPDV